MRKHKTTTAARPAAIEKRAKGKGAWGKRGRVIQCSVDGCPTFAIEADGMTFVAAINGGEFGMIASNDKMKSVIKVARIPVKVARHLAHWLLAVAQDDWQPRKLSMGERYADIVAEDHDRHAHPCCVRKPTDRGYHPNGKGGAQ